jgi:hypothetical protein
MTAEETGPDLRIVRSSLDHSKNLLRRAPQRSRDNAWSAIASAFRSAEQEAQDEWERRMPELDAGNYDEVFLECLELGIERLRAIQRQLQDIRNEQPPRDDV